MPAIGTGIRRGWSFLNTVLMPIFSILAVKRTKGHIGNFILHGGHTGLHRETKAEKHDDMTCGKIFVALTGTPAAADIIRRAMNSKADYRNTLKKPHHTLDKLTGGITFN
ncbi:hypothetical protein [Enterobacter cloacae]|uniref:hypothetical protein n=1 Tax=Enterobacter cloacae TaxID=550 RepID=UPI00377042CB